MKLPRDLSGATLARLLIREFGYRRVHQVGSHVILETDTPRSHRLSIPDHSPLRLGTLHSILRAVASVQSVSREEILSRL